MPTVYAVRAAHGLWKSNCTTTWAAGYCRDANSETGSTLPQRFRQLAAGDQFRHFREVRCQDSIFRDGRGYPPNGGVGRLAALAGLQRRAEVERLGDGQGFDGEYIARVGDHSQLSL